jgi:hypothetical protein
MALQQFVLKSMNVQLFAPRLSDSMPTDPLPEKTSKCRVIVSELYKPILSKVEKTASRTLPIMGRK